MKNNPSSKASIKQSLASFKEHGWNDVRLVEGYTSKDVVPNYCILPNGRLEHILEFDPQFFSTKLAILQNHIRFWELTANSDTPQIYAEHDAICIRDYEPLPEFEDVLALHHDETAYSRPVCTEYTYDTKYKGAKLMIGATCYALTPQGARKLLDEEFVDQGDMMINSYVVNIDTLNPPIVSTIETTHSLGDHYVRQSLS